MAGMSNVGKSSLINDLLSTDVAKVSNTPGKTRQLFFYALRPSQGLVMVDAPGYGLASGNTKEILSWNKMMEMYLKRSTFLHRVVCLVDGRVGVQQMDVEVESLLTSAFQVT